MTKNNGWKGGNGSLSVMGSSRSFLKSCSVTLIHEERSEEHSGFREGLIERGENTIGKGSFLSDLERLKQFVQHFL